MDLGSIHGFIFGFVIIGSWIVLTFWGLALRFTRFSETPTYWRAVSAAQILLAVQLVFGLLLLVLGNQPGPAGGLTTLLFHLSYGILSPLIVLVVAHIYARRGRYNPHSVFALAAFVIFGLTMRAWQVGVFGT